MRGEKEAKGTKGGKKRKQKMGGEKWNNLTFNASSASVPVIPPFSTMFQKVVL